MKYDLSIFEPYIEKGLITKRDHPTLGLSVYNYTDKTTFDKAWDEITTICRGLVLEQETGRVVAKCLEKFWNLSEHESPNLPKVPFHLPYTVHEKVDGSCISIFNYAGQWHTATRGSFTSDQAIKAKELLSNYRIDEMDTGVTLIAEVIYPENKIVVNYGDTEELLFLAAFNTDTGEEMLHNYWNGNSIGMHHAPEYPGLTIEEVVNLQKILPKDREGFVIRFSNGMRVKVKTDEYMKIARLLSNLTPLALWDTMEGGFVPDKYLSQIPEEFRGEWEPIKKELESQHFDIVNEVYKEYKSLDHCMTKRDIGLYLKANPGKLKHGSIMFAVYDNENQSSNEYLDEYAKQMIRPHGNKL